jgi:hypothetical protein
MGLSASLWVYQLVECFEQAWRGLDQGLSPFTWRALTFLGLHARLDHDYDLGRGLDHSVATQPRRLGHSTLVVEHLRSGACNDATLAFVQMR